MMMSIDLTKSKYIMDELSRLNSKLGIIQFRLELLRIRGLLWNSTGMEHVMKEISKQIDQQQLGAKYLREGMEIITQKYTNSENILLGYLGKYAKGENIAFDDNGSYGGNQGSPKSVKKSDEKYKKISEIVRKYYPEYNNKQVNNYLKKLNSEGCGYVALINTIFDQYVGREDEFERIFGFPMYDENGDLNYDLLLVDFYSAMDNHNSSFGHDVVNPNEDSSATQGNGTNMDSREYRWELYLQQHGVDVDVHDVNVTVDNYSNVSQNGEVIVAIAPVIMYDEDGNRIHINGGHAMTVTGVTEDGRFIVSSWGEKYYLDPNEEGFDRINFQQVTY